MNATQLAVRIPPEQLSRLDTYIAAEPDKPSRPEAIRRLLDKALG